MVSSRTIIHAIIGAVVGIVLSFLPFSTVIGGATAGFLEGPDGREGAISARTSHRSTPHSGRRPDEPSVCTTMAATHAGSTIPATDLELAKRRT